MKLFLVLFLSFVFAVTGAWAQADSTQASKPNTASHTHRDSLRLAKLNNSGNLMIAGGVGLCGASGYLLYYGIKVYKTLPDNPASTTYAAELDRNKRQGTIYIAAGSIAAAAGIILTAFGARNKVEFKMRKRLMEMEGGLLHNGQLGLALHF